ncbi:hypothetical protein BKA56DRAFT_256692 [Ilyonectria sp. MPI-CAGE-AT-0026]|nr:hypothetical protein BKA56DRAFT_256692 [Ilyonectria sp. MPI-CAGE-AT-0026]
MKTVIEFLTVPQSDSVNLHHQSVDTDAGEAKFSPQARMFSIDGTINDVQIEANADTGSSVNVISMDLARSMGLTPEPGTQRHILLPAGQKVFSPGRIRGLFKFKNEEKIHELSCVVLENVSYPLVLGSKFLKLTKTFTKHMHRLKRAFSKSTRISLKMFGEEQEFVSGYLNGSNCFAVPDSGSEIMAVSGAFARAHGLKVHRGPNHQHLMEFIDGSEALTDGVVKDLQWQFRLEDMPLRCDFHVIENLPVDAILSGALVDEHDVFSRYEDLLIDMDSLKGNSGIYNIRLSEIVQNIESLEGSFEHDMNADPPFTDEIIEREMARRDLIRDQINCLPADARLDREVQEVRRQHRFEDDWRQHRERLASNRQQNQRCPLASSAQARTQTIPPNVVANGRPSNTTLLPRGRLRNWARWMGRP